MEKSKADVLQAIVNAGSIEKQMAVIRVATAEAVKKMRAERKATSSKLRGQCL